jgi:hypothetical protein
MALTCEYRDGLGAQVAVTEDHPKFEITTNIKTLDPAWGSLGTMKEHIGNLTFCDGHS